MALNMFDTIDDSDLELVSGAQGGVPSWVTDEVDNLAETIGGTGTPVSAQLSLAVAEGGALLRSIG